MSRTKSPLPCRLNRVFCYSTTYWTRRWRLFPSLRFEPVSHDPGAEETKQDEDGNTIDHAEGNELHDTLLAQNLAEHLAAEDLLELELAELEGDLGLLVTGDRDTFEKVLNKIKEYKAYETFV